MESKTIALVIIIIVVILLFTAISYKIKADKKTKSLLVNSPILKGKRSYFLRIPSWGLALLTMFLTFVVLMVMGDILTAIFKIPESDIADLVFYILYNLIIAGGCFYISRQNPKSIWYVPVLCNIIGIISAIIERNFWISSLWIVICSGWALSIIASIIGAQIGRKKTISDDQ